MLRQGPYYPRRGPDLADHPEGDNFGANGALARRRRLRCPRTPGSAELGLPIHLAARLRAGAPGADAAAYSRRRPEPSARGCAGPPAVPGPLQIMYGIRGERLSPSSSCPGWLVRVRAPVRIGNAAVGPVPARRLRRVRRRDVHRRRGLGRFGGPAVRPRWPAVLRTVERVAACRRRDLGGARAARASPPRR